MSILHKMFDRLFNKLFGRSSPLVQPLETLRVQLDDGRMAEGVYSSTLDASGNSVINLNVRLSPVNSEEPTPVKTKIIPWDSERVRSGDYLNLVDNFGNVQNLIDITYDIGELWACVTMPEGYGSSAGLSEYDCSCYFFLLSPSQKGTIEGVIILLQVEDTEEQPVDPIAYEYIPFTYNRYLEGNCEAVVGDTKEPATIKEHSKGGLTFTADYEVVGRLVHMSHYKAAKDGRCPGLEDSPENTLYLKVPKESSYV